MRRSPQAAIDWAANQITHPTQGWQGLCISSVRSAWGTPPWAGSARLWWDKVPAAHKHHTPVKDVPPGAACYAPLGKWGHCWLAGHNGTGFSTDIKRRGHIDRTQLAITPWTHDTKVWWSDWTPFGLLPLGK